MLCGLVHAQEATSDAWGKLIGAGKYDEAEKLCNSWLTTQDVKTKTEALKCLSNVEFRWGQGLSVQGNDVGGGTIGAGYNEGGVVKAIGYLDEALKLSPQDISVHKGRLFILETSLRYDEMAKALDESIGIYQGKNGADEWITYSYELIDSNHLNAALQILNVLDKHYPNSNEVLGNIAVCYMIQKKDKEALQYLQRAVAVAPNDEIDVWNMGRENDFIGNNKEADIWYQKAIALPQNQEKRKDKLCLYGIFVDTKLGDKKRACKLEKNNCTEAKDKSACVVKQP